MPSHKKTKDDELLILQYTKYYKTERLSSTNSPEHWGDLRPEEEADIAPRAAPVVICMINVNTNTVNKSLRCEQLQNDVIDVYCYLCRLI